MYSVARVSHPQANKHNISALNVHERHELVVYLDHTCTPRPTVAGGTRGTQYLCRYSPPSLSMSSLIMRRLIGSHFPLHRFVSFRLNVIIINNLLFITHHDLRHNLTVFTSLTSEVLIQILIILLIILVVVFDFFAGPVVATITFFFFFIDLVGLFLGTDDGLCGGCVWTVAGGGVCA